MELVDKYDNFCIDLDGVMWNGNSSIPGSIEAINYLRSKNKNIFFVTNNAALTREELGLKFNELGFTADTDNLYTTGYAIKIYLKRHFPDAKKLVAIGMPGLLTYLRELGYEIIYPPDLNKSINNLQDCIEFDVEPDVGIVVVAYDVNFDYFSALYCCACIQNGAELVGLNLDRFFIYGSSLIPASGCVAKFIETATKKVPQIVGKPMPFMIDIIVEEHGLDRNKMVMIGDSMESDIMLGINSGIDTILVLSGVTAQSDLERYTFRPTLIMESLGSLTSITLE